MKIVIAADTYYPHVNGASYFTQRLAFYLKQRGHNILVIAPSLNFSSEFFIHEGIKVFGVSSIPIPGHKDFRSSLLAFLSRNKIGNAIKEFNPDIIHLQSHFFINKVVLKIAQDRKKPVIGTNLFMPENLVHYLHLPPGLEKKVIKAAWKQFTRVFNKLDGITAPTRTAANLAEKIGFSKKIFPISCGIDLKKYNPDNNGDYLRKKYKIPSKPILLYLGRLDKEKNVDFILSALTLALKKIDFHFVIAGKGKRKQKLEKLAQDLNIEKNVTFTGFVSDEDKPNLYGLADCFVIAGDAELQSIATMEAMASGLPVIGIKAIALPELIRHGENGYLFKAGDKESLAEYIVNILSDKILRERMSKRSQNIIKEHDINVSILKFESLYKKFIDKNEKHTNQA